MNVVKNRKSLFRRSLSLILSIVILWAFTFVFAPFLMQFEVFQTMADHIEEQDIDSTAIWWSEVKACAEAEANCRNTVKYLPHGPIEKEIVLENQKIESEEKEGLVAR
jgi:hypothetical protein